MLKLRVLHGNGHLSLLSMQNSKKSRINLNLTVILCQPKTGDDSSKPKNDEADNKLEVVLEVYSRPVNPTINIDIQKATAFGACGQAGVYTMRTRHRGVLFYANIINFQDGSRRRGAEFDTDNFIALFRQLGFDIFYYENITAEVSPPTKLFQKR